MKNEKGSIVLETSMALPLVLLVMLAFVLLVRYFVVYETVQHGMYEATRQVSAYYYLYAATGLEENFNAMEEEKQEAAENLNMLAEPFNTTIGYVRHISSSIADVQSALGTDDTQSTVLQKTETIASKVDSIVQDAQGLGTSVQDCSAAVQLIMESPLETVTYILKYALQSGLGWAQNSLMNLWGQALLSEHIPGRNLERYTEACGISEMHTAMAWNQGGSGDVEMMTSYKFTIRLFGGFDFWVTQKTSAKGWGLGV